MPATEKPTKSPVRIVGIVAMFILFVTAIPSALVAVFLLLDGETWLGRLFAASWLLMCATVFCVYQRLQKRRTARTRVMAFVGGSAAIGFAFCYLLAPAGKSLPNSKLQSVFLGGSHYSSWTPAALVPEMDQAKLGADLSPFADSLMTRTKAARMKSLFCTAYREMDQDPEFVNVGSVMGCVYADALGFPCGHKHLFAYVPEHKAGQKLPVILFLHGSVGNFKVYIWTWKRFADAHKVAIVAPSFGFGNWDQSGGMEAIDAAYDYCIHRPDLDVSRVVLAGLSNGGIGVSRAFSRHPERYEALIYISAVMEPGVMEAPAFQQACRGKRVLVLHGSQDERIPVKYVQEPVSALEGKAQIQTKIYQGEDHFLFLSRRDEVLADVARWASW